MLSANLSRRGGLAATVTAPLFIVADLLGLFTVSVQGPAYGMIIQNIVAVGAGAVLLLGLIALYGHYLEAMSKPSLLGFLVILVGLLLAAGIFLWAYWLGEQGWSLFFIWASLLANLGWILLGAVSLETQIYPRGPVVLIVGVVLYGVTNALIGSGAQSGVLSGSENYVVGVLIYNVVLSVAIGLFGLRLFRRGKEEN
jgi:hypothetical protein